MSTPNHLRWGSRLTAGALPLSHWFALITFPMHVTQEKGVRDPLSV